VILHFQLFLRAASFTISYLSLLCGLPGTTCRSPLQDGVYQQRLWIFTLCPRSSRTTGKSGSLHRRLHFTSTNRSGAIRRRVPACMASPKQVPGALYCQVHQRLCRLPCFEKTATPCYVSGSHHIWCFFSVLYSTHLRGQLR